MPVPIMSCSCPPEEDGLTDKDNDEDGGILLQDPYHLGRGILPQVTEILDNDEVDQLPELMEVCICVLLININYMCMYCTV